MTSPRGPVVLGVRFAATGRSATEAFRWEPKPRTFSPDVVSTQYP